MLRVEGRLTQQTAEELRMACEPMLNDRAGLRLELSGLRFVDPAGVTLLRGLAAAGAVLEGGSSFVTTLLRDDRPAAATEIDRDDDGQLIERLRRGDEDAFALVVHCHGGRLLAAARRLMPSEDDARDVVQEGFIAAFRAIDGFAGAAKLSTWLHRIVVNAALMRLRARRRRREEPIEPLLPAFDEHGSWVDAPTAWETASDVLVAREETRALVRRAIARLPETYRTVLVLRDLEELDTDEAAAVLGISPNAVKTRLHRARQALKTLLDGAITGRASVPAALGA